MLMWLRCALCDVCVLYCRGFAYDSVYVPGVLLGGSWLELLCCCGFVPPCSVSMLCCGVLCVMA